MVEAPVQRVVPGAPPPTPLSKSQKKKRKAKSKPEGSVDSPVAVPDPTSAALIEKAPEASDVQDGSVAADLVVQPEVDAPPLPEEEVLLKPSPIVDLIHKRLKATTKKISRISIYASTDPEKLNDDQKRTLKTLPTLEAVQKELAEVKKAVEVHESELVHELSIKRIEADKAEKARIANAVSAAEAAVAANASEFLSFLRLRALLASGDLDASTISMDNAEAAAVFVAGDVLLGEDNDRKQAAVHGFLFNTGDFEGIPYSRLLEITHHGLNPPRTPTPVPEEPETIEEQQDPPAPSTVESEPDAPVAGVPGAISTSGSFHFMQESELENPTFEDGAEWVERSDAQAENAQLPSVAGEVATNGDIQPPPSDVPIDVPPAVGHVDWAADDQNDLPSIEGLHATFKTSGSATPVGDAPEELQASTAPANGHAQTNGAVDDDGFTQARGGRGRGRGSRGDNRGYRGPRGDGRGNFRGGGFRGAPRGGDRGGFRGRGEWRGDGEGRGRGGRGRGRGGERGGAPQAPSTPA
ncbi:hypothetical protein BD779DRAFT_1620446 [Infundibulicybe gibba]|nr:hypothetical protein BD779DRAFT_1620446 [Infundibulicybe gibba]